MDVRLVSREDGEYIELGREVSMLSLLIAAAYEDVEETTKGENKESIIEGFNVAVPVPTPILRLVVEFMTQKHNEKDFIIEKVGEYIA